MSLFTLPAAPNQPKLNAVLALIVHAGQTDIQVETAYAFTTHDIQQTASGVVLGPGRLFGHKDQQELLAILLDCTARDNEFLPADVLSRGVGRLSWYVPGRVRSMWFRNGTHTWCLNVPWPSLVFCLTPNGLRLAAYEGQGRPYAQQKIYHAPLMNIHRDTFLCSGTAKIPKAGGLNDRSECERVCFETAFSHCNHPHTLRLKDHDEVDNAKHIKFWKVLAKCQAEVFPTDALNPLPDDLSGWLSQR